MSGLFSTSGWLAGAAAVTLAGAAAVAAQPAGQQPSSPPGFFIDGDQPVKITARKLEVRDKIRRATFLGDVKLARGDTTVTCNTLVVFYEDDHRITRAECK